MWCQRDPVTRRTGIGNLFVNNLDFFVTDVKLEDVSGRFGRCNMAEYDYGKSKDFGFVQFDSEESANIDVETLGGSVADEKIIELTLIGHIVDVEITVVVYVV
ncbi:putative RNA recognition motif domain, nucleotide-binding alpha-beta plait domain superfamily [Helianthus annuus]|nr:putative RNA recognition motif domain, nucleotide-binding alpha-beta plait domain superfamily [Helianthus annuus]KAJ0760663.1 putative RNA recognition motif domain, nucleotide-binding alpha-beta plait domain superfamily [Helianthus annuus]